MYRINKICVCGAGTMGSGIAQLAAMAGYQTIQFDLNDEMLRKSQALISKNLQFLVDKTKISSVLKDETLGLIRFTSNIDDCIADLFIEAIVEKLEAKTALFRALAKNNPETAILATNTSSIAVTEIARGVSYPERVIGMHFFNPAPLMKLVEVIRTDDTSKEVIDTVVEIAQKMNKTAVICRDSPGFIVNRVARHYYLEAMTMVEKGLTTPGQADAIMEATGFKMGPFKLMDLIGMDINYSVSRIVWESLGSPARLRPSALQQQKVEKGELGRKTGKGFYTYE